MKIDKKKLQMLVDNLKKNSKEQIEASLVYVFLIKQGIDIKKIKNKYILDILLHEDRQISMHIKEELTEMSLEVLVDIFELLLEKDNISENGVVFTPSYIVEYILKNTFMESYKSNSNFEKKMLNMKKIIDPACGCGIFLIGIIDYFKKMMNIKTKDIVENTIYGIDLEPENVHRTKIVLNLACIKDGYYETVKTNIEAHDSLSTDWNKCFDVSGFDYIIGNPPYVNAHDMKKETVKFLKSTFKTTVSGTFNIFYAFVERSMEYLLETGQLGFIVPNNFLTIKSAEALRGFIQSNRYLDFIVDFKDNMIFKPVRTYNSIIILNKQDKESVNYKIIEKTDELEEELNECKIQNLEYKNLNSKGWNFVNEEVSKNIKIIESHTNRIKEFIRTGIATLKDDIYILDTYDDDGYYKEIDSEKIYIEKELIKKLYKVSKIKDIENVEKYRKAIIFPYKKGDERFEIIEESIMKKKYPKCYRYLKSVKSTLDKRDKGKPNKVAWYAYGRSQGLSKFGKKLLFPTFAKYPKFIIEEDDTALFCNGYAVFENDKYDLNVLSKILNSNIMKYYVDNTSYSIEGGYMCYQKKYIENFSIPFLTEEEKAYLIKEKNREKVNVFLMNKYGVKIK